MAEYKQTLNLPKTAFPMKASLATREPEMLNAWQESAIYAKVRQTFKGKQQFILHDGPPYANGHLHCGHALNKILKDIVVKSKTLSGYDSPFVPGWDCHGLPIELNVEKKIGKAGIKVTPEHFRAKCREYAASQIDIQRNEFKRLGVFGDWDNPYITMDYHYEANIIRSLGKIIANGHLQQGFKPVHWCIDCGSALAEAEVEYENKTSHSIDVAFELVDKSACFERFNIKASTKPVVVPIWTTTPWTLPANEAVSVHPDITYSLVYDKENDRYFIIAQDMVAGVMARFKVSDFDEVAHTAGASLEYLQLQHPFNDRLVPVTLGEHVTTEAGTGCVHTAPAHGPDDYVIGLNYELPLINPVMANGCYAEDVPLFAGLHVFKANKEVRAVLEQNKRLLSDELLEHSYPHCWRHKTPMIFRATPQWFIAMDKNQLRDNTLKAIEKTQFIPQWGQARINSMVENRPDWCISRQRAWGTPITLFVHQKTKELHPNSVELIEQIAKRVEDQGIDAWFNLDIAELLGEKANEYEKVTDTLDVWFDSGVTHYCVLSQRSNLTNPADLYLEGSDQHRGWFNSSITTGVAMNGHAPYKAVLTHGYTVDANGHKLSKSKGNYVELDKLIKQYGADIIRLWVSSTDYRNEVSISDEILKRTSDAYRRIRNTARFLLSNLFDFEPANHLLETQDLVELDKWAIKRVALLQQEIQKAYDEYNFHLIYQKLHNFCTVEMGSFYLDIIKDRQYTAATQSVARRSCQTAMFHILHAFVRWLAPILSFTADEIWKNMPGQTTESVFLVKWYDEIPRVDDVDMTYWQTIQAVRDEVNKALEVARQEGRIGSGLEAKVTLYANADLYDALSRLGDELRFVLITSKATVELVSSQAKQANPTEIDGLALGVQALELEKCERCWHRSDEIGLDANHPLLCQRCVGNITGNDETRKFA